MATWPGWERDVLTAIKAPINADTLGFADRWQSFEGGTARNNPWNTTQPEPGATNYNSKGVKNYVSSAQGTRATVTTLENGFYPDILAALRSGKPFAYGDKGAVASQLQKWGSFNFANWYLQQGITAQPAATLPGAAAARVAPQALSGFTHFTRSLGVTLPTRLRQARKIRRATLRALR